MQYPKAVVFDYKNFEKFALSLVRKAQDIVDDGEKVSDEIIRSAWHKKEMRKVLEELYEKELEYAKAEEIIALGNRMGWRDTCSRFRSGSEFVRMIDHYLGIERLLGVSGSSKYNEYVAVLLEDNTFRKFAEEAIRRVAKEDIDVTLLNTLSDIVREMLESEGTDMSIVILKGECLAESVWDLSIFNTADIIAELYGLNDVD